MKFIFILLLMALTLIFPINVSMAENNNFIKSLTGFQWSMGLSLTSDEIYVVDGLYNKILVFSKSDIEKNISINELKKIFDINSFKINMAFFDFHTKIESSGHLRVIKCGTIFFINLSV